MLAGAGASDEAMQALIARRRDGHWASRLMAQSSGVRAGRWRRATTRWRLGRLSSELKARFDAGFSFANAEAALMAYQAELFRFDQLYRHFHEAAEKVSEPMGWAVLHELRVRIENLRGGSCRSLVPPGRKVIEGEGGLLSQWTAAGMPNQHRFFDIQVAPCWPGAKRVFVVISDAFRYEAAEELVQRLNSKSRFKAGCSGSWVCCRATPRWGWRQAAAASPVWPTKANSNLDVLADGQPVSFLRQRPGDGEDEGLRSRPTILRWPQRVAGARSAGDLRVPHHIDALGDKQATGDDVPRGGGELASFRSW